MGEVLRFVTPDGGKKVSEKKHETIFADNSILRLFLVKFRFKKPVLSSAKCAQNKHKKN